MAGSLRGTLDKSISIHSPRQHQWRQIELPALDLMIVHRKLGQKLREQRFQIERRTARAIV